MTKNQLLAVLSKSLVRNPDSVGITTEEVQMELGHRDPRKARVMLKQALDAGLIKRVTRYKVDLAGRVIPIPAFVPAKRK